MTTTTGKQAHAALAMASRRERLVLSPTQRALASECDRMTETRLAQPWRFYREIAVLPSLFNDDERLVDLALAHLLFGVGLLVLTGDRLLFVRYRIVIPSLLVKTFSRGKLERHRVIRQGRFARLELHLRDSWRSREFHGMAPGDADRISGELGGHS
jgi:hypothetical protein